MKILDPKNGVVSTTTANTDVNQNATNANQLAKDVPDTKEEFDAKVGEILHEASKVKAEAEAESGNDQDKEEPVDVKSHTESDKILKSASSDPTRYDLNGMLTDQPPNVTVTKDHKDRFIDSVITGERYTEDFSLMNGRLNIRVRSRSMEETDAIGSYANVMIDKGEVKRTTEYSSLLKKLLCVAQVDRINGVVYPPMESPLFFTEHPDRRDPPAWEPRLKAWSEKPDSLVAAVVKCVIEFEARYWHMINHVDDKNFWQSGESTGE